MPNSDKPIVDQVRNRLLRQFPAEALRDLYPALEWIALVPRAVLFMPDDRATSLVFVETGTISMIGTLENGDQIEVGLVGPEGVAGLSVVLGAPTSPLEALVQAEGGAFRLCAAAFRTALAAHPAMLGPLLRYVDAFHVQVAQTAVCNGHHEIEQRLARWILMTQDRVGTEEFTMTQEFMSHMLGVRRPSVTLTMGRLQRAGLVRSSGGKVRVLDRAGLEAVACECYEIVRRRYAWLFE